MDINSLIIAAAIIVTSAILLYMISLFTMKDKTYEEVVAEQRKQVEAESERQKMLKKADKDLLPKKKGKKKPEKVKEPVTRKSESDVVKVAKQQVSVKPVNVQVVPVATVKPQAPAKPVKQQQDASVKQLVPASPVKKRVESVNEPKKSAEPKKSPEPNKAPVKEQVTKKVVKTVEQSVPKESKKDVNHVGDLTQKSKKDGKDSGDLNPKPKKDVKDAADLTPKPKKGERIVVGAEEVPPPNVKKSSKNKTPDAVTTVVHAKQEPPQAAPAKEKKAPKVTEKPVEKQKSVPTEKPKPANVEKAKVAVQDKPKVQEGVKTRQVEQPMMTKQVVQNVASPPVSQKQKNKSGGDASGLPITSVACLLTCAKNCSLSDSELQMVIEALHSKHGDNASFTAIKKKGDPLTMVRAQLEEKEKALQEEQQLAMAANSRLKVVKTELAQQKSHYTHLEKSSVEKVHSLQQEIQALHARMQQTHDGHGRDLDNMKTQHDSITQQIREENNQLKEQLTIAHAAVAASDHDNLKTQVQIMQSEMNKNALKMNAAEREKKSLEQAVEKKKSNENVMKKKLEEAMQQANKAESKTSQMNQELHKSTEAMNSAQKECHSLKAKLHELDKNLKEMDHSTRTMENKLKIADNDKSRQDDALRNLEMNIKNSDNKCAASNMQLQDVQRENEALQAEIQACKQRESEVLAKASEVVPVDMSDKIGLAEHEKILNDKNEELSALSCDVRSSKSTITDLMKQIEAQKHKNNELREKNWKAIEAMHDAEKNSQQKNEERIQLLTDEHRETMSTLQLNQRATLQRLLPNIDIDSDLNYQDWTNCYEHEATQYIRDLATQSRQPVEINTTLQIKLRDSEEQISQLKSSLAGLENSLTVTEEKMCRAVNIAETSQEKIAEAETRLMEMESKGDELSRCKEQLKEAEGHIEVQHGQIADYRNVLSETEQKFKELEGNVDTEEKRWRSQTTQYECDLEKAKEEITTLQVKLADLDKLKHTDNPEPKPESDIGFAYRCVEQSLTNIVDEMQEKAERLDEDLKMSEESRQSVEQEFTEIQERADKLNAELQISEQSRQSIQEQFADAQENISKMKAKLEEAEKSTTQSDELQTTIDEMKKNLDEEKLKSKNFASEVIKLKSIVKCGQAALLEEQNLVKQIQMNNAAGDQKSHGTSSSSSSSSDEDTEALKAKLLETQKKLEREVAANRQLNQRLSSHVSPDTSNGRAPRLPETI